jgi:hypothetical protein
LPTFFTRNDAVTLPLASIRDRFSRSAEYSKREYDNPCPNGYSASPSKYRYVRPCIV